MRFPVCLWEDQGGLTTAAIIDPELRHAVAVDSSRESCLRQLKAYLSWKYEHHPWSPSPTMTELHLRQFKVTVRPEYLVEQRSYPSAKTLALQVACVYGFLEDRTLKVVLPRLGISFYCQDEKHLKELVSHYVRTTTKGANPADLARLLPSRHIEVDEIVQRRPKDEEAEEDVDYGVLEVIGDALGARSSRRNLSKPYGREAQVATLVAALDDHGTNVLLVGDTGSGKTALLVEAVRQIERRVDGEGKKQRRRYRHWLTSAGRLIAGMKYLGQWQARCEAVIATLARINGVLCVENLLELLRVGGVDETDSVGAFLMPFLRTGELQLVGETTADELDACRRLAPAMADLFQIVRLPTFQGEAARAALQLYAEAEERQVGVDIGPSVVETTCRLFGRFQPYAAMPGSAADFLHDLCVRKRNDGQGLLEDRDVIAAFVERTGLPETFLRDEIPLAADTVTETLTKEVISQQTACEIVSNTVTTFKAGLTDPNRPIGVLLFCGPTGVGKTQLARSLSEYLFGAGTEGKRLLRLDMSEYGLPGAAERLIMQPDGSPSDFISTIRQQPFTVLLLDEIEKAHPEVFDVLLTLLDEGRLVDSSGRSTSFQSSIIIMTSNAGASTRSTVGFGDEPVPSYEKAIEAIFRPEFINRIDRVVPFAPLDRNTIRQVVAKELQNLGTREGLVKRRLELVWDDDVIELIAEQGFDPRYGARRLQRTIDQLVLAPLAYFLLRSPVGQGATVRLRVSDDNAINFVAESRRSSHCR